LGYKGYQDLKIKVSADIAFKTRKIRGVVNIDDDLDAIIAKITKNNMQAIESTMDVLSRGEINKAVEAIMKAERVDIYGIGASAIVAQDAMHKFMRINKACTAYYAGGDDKKRNLPSLFCFHRCPRKTIL